MFSIHLTIVSLTGAVSHITPNDGFKYGQYVGHVLSVRCSFVLALNLPSSILTQHFSSYFLHNDIKISSVHFFA